MLIYLLMNSVYYERPAVVLYDDNKVMIMIIKFFFLCHQATT